MLFLMGFLGGKKRSLLSKFLSEEEKESWKEGDSKRKEYLISLTYICLKFAFVQGDEQFTYIFEALVNASEENTKGGKDG